MQEGEDVPGVDLSPALLGREPPPELRAFSHTSILVNKVAEQMRDSVGTIHELRPGARARAVVNGWRIGVCEGEVEEVHRRGG